MIPFEQIREQALKLGWDDVGVTQAVIPVEDILAYRDWLAHGYQGDLHYMEKQMRCHPEQLLPGAKSAIIFISNYRQPTLPFREDAGLIASYARGRNYHNVHHRRLKKMIRWIEQQAGQTGIAKGFSDSAPVLEKALAVQAGLGWFGKNSLLIHRRFGTFTLLSGLFTTLDLQGEVVQERMPRCGVCTRCLDACPTGALVAPYAVDAKRCLSYHLIEEKGAIPDEIQQLNPGYVFGCDACQDACPHNWRKPASEQQDFTPEAGIGNYLTADLLEELKLQPERLYGTPLQRQGVEGLETNLRSLKLER